MSRKLASLFAAIAIAAATIPSAAAETDRNTISVKVSYADLDLSRVEGVKTLSFRLRKAIDVACGKPYDSASMTIARKIKTCRADALEAAVAAIDSPLLSALHQSGQFRRVAGL